MKWGCTIEPQSFPLGQANPGLKPRWKPVSWLWNAGFWQPYENWAFFSIEELNDAIALLLERTQHPQVQKA